MDSPTVPMNAAGAPPPLGDDADVTSPTVLADGVEVINEQQAEAMEDSEYVERRKQQRRAKLGSYFTQEFNSVVGALELKAGEMYSRALRGAAAGYASPSDGPAASSAAASASAAADASARYMEVTRGSGRRLAWCRDFDSRSGRGVLVDLEERSEWVVTAWSLKVNDPTIASASRVLHAGEFVEYCPAAARELADGGAPADGWVCGILGWPLMCEAAVDAGVPAPLR